MRMISTSSGQVLCKVHKVFYKAVASAICFPISRSGLTEETTINFIIILSF